MRVTDIQITVRQAQPTPDPIRDALQTLPRAGSVEVVAQADTGVSGRGSSWFGRIPGAPVALAAIIEHEPCEVRVSELPAPRTRRDTNFRGHTQPARLRGTHFVGRQAFRPLRFRHAFASQELLPAPRPISAQRETPIQRARRTGDPHDRATG